MSVLFEPRCFDSPKMAGCNRSKSAGEELNDAVREYARVKRTAVEKGVRDKAAQYRQMASDLRDNRGVSLSGEDSLGFIQREILGVMTVGAVAIGAGMLSGSRNIDEVAAFIAANSATQEEVGAVVGADLSTNRV